MQDETVFPADLWKGFCSRYFSAPKVTVAAIFSVIFLFAFWVRVHSFWLPHWQQDQSQYLTLAMKLDAYGLEGYNLEEVQIEVMRFAAFPEWQYIYPMLREISLSSDLAGAKVQPTTASPSVPVYYKAPLFSAMLAFSHSLLTKPAQPFGVFTLAKGKAFQGLNYQFDFMKLQWWAVIVPFLSSLFLIALTYTFGNKLFGPRAGLLAMALISLQPFEILISYKLIPDSYLAFYVILSLYIFYRAQEKRSLLGVFVAGLFGGLAVMTKQRGIFILPTVWLYILLSDDKPWRDIKNIFSTFLNRYFLIFLFGILFLSLDWYSRAAGVYGNPFYEPTYARRLTEDPTGWFRFLGTRPPLGVLFLTSIPFLCPPILAGYFTLIDFLKGIFSRREANRVMNNQQTAERKAVLFCWCWILPILISFSIRKESREERYLLTLFPALAMAAGFQIDRARSWCLRFVPKPILLDVLIGVLLVITAAWSVPIALENAFGERMLILSPWKHFLKFYHVGFH